MTTATSNTLTLKAATTDIVQYRRRNDLTVDMTITTPVNQARIGDHAVQGDPITQYVVGFELPVLSEGTVIDSVELSFNHVAKGAISGALTHNVDLWIVGYGASITPFQNWYLGDAAGVPRGGTSSATPGAILVQDNILVPSSSVGLIHTDAAGNEVLTNSVKAFYAAMKAQGQAYAGGHCVYLRMNPDRAPTDGNTTSGYHVDGSMAATAPTLNVRVTQPTVTEDTFEAARPNKAIDTSLWKPFGMVFEENGRLTLQGTASHPYVQSVREFTAQATVPLVLDITFSATSTIGSYVYTQSSAGQYNGAISDAIGFFLGGNNAWELVKVQGGVRTTLLRGESLAAIQPDHRYELRLVDTGSTLKANLVVKDGTGSVLMTRGGSAAYTFTPTLSARYVGLLGRNGATMWVDSIRISSL